MRGFRGEVNWCRMSGEKYERCPGSWRRVREFRDRGSRPEHPVYCPFCDIEAPLAGRNSEDRGRYVLIWPHERLIERRASRDAWWRPLRTAREDFWLDDA